MDILSSKFKISKITLTERFIQRKKDEYDKLVAHLEIDREKLSGINR